MSQYLKVVYTATRPRIAALKITTNTFISEGEPTVSEYEYETVSDRAMQHDPELEKVIQEALALRITVREIAEAAGLSEVVLWRWRTRVRPSWDRREQGIAGIRSLIEETRREYISGA